MQPVNQTAIVLADNEAPDKKVELANKIMSMTREQLDLFISLARKELRLQDC